MSRSERRILNNKIRRQRELRKNILLAVLTICLVITLSFTVNSFLSNAESGNKNVEFKYYKSIVVEKGDTLWSIASETMNSDYEDTEACVKEIMEMNGLHGDEITAGSHLIIPYFSNEFVG